MEPNQNVQNDSYSSATNANNGVAVVAEPVQESMRQEAPTPSVSNTVVPEKPKKKKSSVMAFGMVLMVIAMICGIGFGVWTMMDAETQKKELNSQISSLKQENAKLQGQTKEAYEYEDVVVNVETDNYYKNPVIKSSNTESFYSIGFQSSNILEQGSAKRISMSVVDGKIDSCNLMERVDDISWKNVGECKVNGLSGNIYKIVEFGEGQDNGNNMIGFIMEDGKVAYFGLYDFALSNSTDIKGYLNINGIVTDALEINVGSNGATGGYGSTVFVLNDGGYKPFDNTML